MRTGKNNARGLYSQNNFQPTSTKPYPNKREYSVFISN